MVSGKKVMGFSPRIFLKCGDDCPVVAVSWDETQKFIKKLNELEGTDRYRLPTEAEWEYAARAGTTTDFSFGEDAGQLGEYAWFKGNSDDRTHPVGTKKSNPWGLYDIYGNVWEWMEDDYHFNYRKAPADGTAWVDKPRGTHRVIRGGGYDYDALGCRSALRVRESPNYGGAGIGFRLVRSVTLGL
jgi:formylglycine-generating enzyme required for sulfatase activity